MTELIVNSPHRVKWSVEISVLTATFNRRDLLVRLYASLCLQRRDCFEWIVVDDGSTDETSKYLASIKKDAPFKITTLHQDNGGKHRAINRAVDAAIGRYCLIVDSDDRLIPGAMDFFLFLILKNKQDGYIFDICVETPAAGRVARECANAEFTNTAKYFSYRDLFRVKEDKVRLVMTSKMRIVKFPEISDESFVTEAVIWMPLHRMFRFVHYPYAPILVEYQSDGLSANYKALLRKNPRGSLFAAQRALASITFSRTYIKFVLLHLTMGLIGGITK